MQLWTKVILVSLIAMPISLLAQQDGDKRTLANGVKKSNGSTQSSGYDSNMAESNTASAPTSNTISWMTDYSAGMQKAKREHKAVFLYFTGSDWCGWCKKLDMEALSQPDFAQAVGNDFVFIKLDFPMNRAGSDAEMQQNAKLKQQYGVTGFPTVILLDSKGSFVAETGYRSGGARAYAAYIEQLMRSPNS